MLCQGGTTNFGSHEANRNCWNQHGEIEKTDRTSRDPSTANSSSETTVTAAVGRCCYGVVDRIIPFPFLHLLDCRTRRQGTFTVIMWPFDRRSVQFPQPNASHTSRHPLRQQSQMIAARGPPTVTATTWRRLGDVRWSPFGRLTAEDRSPEKYFNNWWKDNWPRYPPGRAAAAAIWWRYIDARPPWWTVNTCRGAPCTDRARATSV